MDNDDVLTALPRYQVAHAARLGLTDPGKVFDFVVANQDQPDSFWFSGSVDVIMKEATETADARRISSAPARIRAPAPLLDPVVPSDNSPAAVLLRRLVGSPGTEQFARATKALTDLGANLSDVLAIASSAVEPTPATHTPGTRRNGTHYMGTPTQRRDEASEDKMDVGVTRAVSGPAMFTSQLHRQRSPAAKLAMPPSRTKVSAPAGSSSRSLAPERIETDIAKYGISVCDAYKLSLRKIAQLAPPPITRVSPELCVILVGFPPIPEEFQKAFRRLDAKLAEDKVRELVVLHAPIDESTGLGTGTCYAIFTSAHVAEKASKGLKGWHPAEGYKLETVPAAGGDEPWADPPSASWMLSLTEGDIVDVNLLSPAVQSPTLSPDTARIGMNVCVSRLEVDTPSKSTEVGDDKQTQMTLFNVPAELVGWVTDEENTMGDVSNMPTLDEDQPVHMCHVRVSVGDAEALRHMWVPMGNTKLIQPEVDDNVKDFWVQARVLSVSKHVDVLAEEGVAVGDTVCLADDAKPTGPLIIGAIGKVVEINDDEGDVCVEAQNGCDLRNFDPSWWYSKSDVVKCKVSDLPFAAGVTLEVIDPSTIPFKGYAECHAVVDNTKLDVLVNPVQLTLRGRDVCQAIRYPGEKCVDWQFSESTQKDGVAVHVTVNTCVRVPQQGGGGNCDDFRVTLEGSETTQWVHGSVISDRDEGVLAVELDPEVPVTRAAKSISALYWRKHSTRRRLLAGDYLFLIFAIDKAWGVDKLSEKIQEVLSNTEDYALSDADVSEFSCHDEDDYPRMITVAPGRWLLPRDQPPPGPPTADDIARLKTLLLDVQKTATSAFSLVPRKEVIHSLAVKVENLTPKKHTATPIFHDGKIVCLFERNTSLFREKTAAARSIAMETPEALVGSRAIDAKGRVKTVTRRPKHLRRAATVDGEIIAYAPGKRVHIVQTADDSLESVNFLKHGERTPSIVAKKLSRTTDMAPASMYFRQCIVCDEQCKADDFASFCFQRYRITGDGEDVGDPRHPATICKECISQHASIGINEGHLYVKCPFPDCGRSLQTLELRELVPTDVYEKLVSGIKEMESGKASLSSFDVPEGLQLRLCPACHARIEKNEGCDSMICYRCGEEFDWEDAQQLVVVPKRNWAAVVAGVSASPPAAAESEEVQEQMHENVGIGRGRGRGGPRIGRGRGRGRGGRGRRGRGGGGYWW